VQAPLWQGAPTPHGQRRAEEEMGEAYEEIIQSAEELQVSMQEVDDSTVSIYENVIGIGVATGDLIGYTEEFRDKFIEINPQLDELQTKFENLLQTMASDAVIGFFQAIGDAATGAMSLGESMKKMLADMASKIGQMMVQAGLQLIIANAYNPAMVGIGLALIAAGGLSIIGGTALGNTGGSGGGGELPRMATGGIVTKPTVAMIGEAGPEAIVPLGRGGAGGGVNIYVNGSIWQTEDLARAVAGVMSRW